MSLLGAVMATTPPPAHPDLSPGAGQQRDAALDAAAAATTMERPLPAPARSASDGERRAEAAMTEELEAARHGRVLDAELQVAMPVLVDPLTALLHLG